VRSNGVDVLFIAGTGRSGSTWVESVLARECGYVAVGELDYIWTRSLRDNQLCGCGRPFDECDFWQAVLERAFGGIDRCDHLHFAELANTVRRVRNIPALGRRAVRPPGLAIAFAEYADALQRLYAAIAEVSQAPTVIDSSKDPRHGFVVAATPGVRLRPLHLVRDSRAVAYSWQRLRPRPEVHWAEESMPRYRPHQVVRRWLVSNVLAEALRHRVAGGQRLRYEDISDNPSTLDRLVREERARSASTRAPGEPLLHSVSGNPLRFKESPEPVRRDDAWRTGLSAEDYWFVTATTAPLLARYGYPISRSPRG
jgi:hypothetical protein